MGVISTWLKGIGLSHVAPTFKAAGIVTPEDLATLDVSHYKALGVTEASDRKKLFYLVQRIKVAVVEKESKEQDFQDQDELLVKSTVENTRIVLDSDDDDDEEEEYTRPTRRSTRSQTMKTRAASNVKENNENHRTSRQAKRVSSRRSSLPSARRSSTGVSVRATRASMKSDTDESGRDNDDASTTSQRSSKRLQNKSSSTVGSRGHPSTGSSISGRRTAPAATSSRRQSTGTSTRNSTRRSSEQLTTGSNNRRRALSSSDADSSEESSTSSYSRSRSTGAPKPRTSRYESKLPNRATTRTGKQLSSIPANSIAPMSPLVDLPKSRLDADIAIQEQKTTAKPATRGRRKSIGGGLSRSSSSSSLDGSTNSRRNTAPASGSTTDSNRRKSTGRASLGRSSSNSRRRSVSNGRGSGVAKSSSLRDVSSFDSVESSSNPNRRSLPASAPTPVFVHGLPVDDSWATQVSQMREDNDAEHELFQGDGGEDNSLDRMRIRVVVRKRPMSKKEASTKGEIDVIHPLDYGTYGKVLVYQPKTRVDLTKEVESVKFAFDNTFDQNANNVQIYERTIRNMIPGVFEGQWASLFAYGQTGSGKTFTMMGCNLTGSNAGGNQHDESNLGLYYLAALDVFKMADAPENRHLSVGVSLFEIYGGKLFDLLNARSTVKCLEDHRGKVCFPGLSEHPVTNAQQLMEVIEAGAANRSTGTTSKNADSSRSHAVMHLSLRKRVGRNNNVEHGRLTFIDLAGSERGADTSQSSRGTRREGADINTSLLALKEVIRALATGDSMAHIPFRGSKLTQVLKESFVGKNARSAMVACIAPNSGNCEHTLNTLRYANRVKERDAETGYAAVDSTSATNKVKIPVHLSRALSAPMEHTSGFDDMSGITSLGASPHQSLKDEWDEGPEIEQEEVNGIRNDDDSDLLDRLLTSNSSSPSRKSLELAMKNSSYAGDQPTKRQIAEPLIATHRQVMSEMLEMVKTEMTMVNNTDLDRENMDDYLLELSALKEKQLSLLSNLQEALLDYFAASGSTASYGDGGVSDDSFEDLRD